jgi:hypothetical protein
MPFAIIFIFIEFPANGDMICFATQFRRVRIGAIVTQIALHLGGVADWNVVFAGKMDVICTIISSSSDIVSGVKSKDTPKTALETCFESKSSHSMIESRKGFGHTACCHDCVE